MDFNYIETKMINIFILYLLLKSSAFPSVFIRIRSIVGLWPCALWRSWSWSPDLTPSPGPGPPVS
jgi:hypothetical protein